MSYSTTQHLSTTFVAKLALRKMLPKNWMPRFLGLAFLLLLFFFAIAANQLNDAIQYNGEPEQRTASSLIPQNSEKSASQKFSEDKVEKQSPDNAVSMDETAYDGRSLRNESMPRPKRKTGKYCDKHNSKDVRPCIFDIGLNTGQDTLLYLGSPDSRVVAVEANPTLVKGAKKKFRDEIAAGRLKLLNIGLVGNESETGEDRPKLEFWINTHNDVFSSFRRPTGCRSPRGEFLPEGNTTFCRKIKMDTMSCSELIKEYGTPVYMKIDIEGMDEACLRALGNVPEKDRPKYVSKENVWKHDVELLASMGYKKFKIVNQNILQVGHHGSEMEGNSGPWGENAKDFWKGKKWDTREELLARLPLPDSIVVNGNRIPGWYDLHGKK